MTTMARVRVLRVEATAAGDHILSDICDVWISGEDSDGTGTTLGIPCSFEHAQREIERVLAEEDARVR